MKPGISLAACTIIAGLAGCSTFGSKTLVNSTGTTGDCGYNKPDKCEVTISYDSAKGYTFTPDTLTVHFNPNGQEPQPVTWRIKSMEGDGAPRATFAASGGVLFAHLDPDGGPFHSLQLGTAADRARQLRSLTFSLVDTCGLACKTAGAPEQRYDYGLVLYDDAGKIIKTLDPGLINSGR